LLRNHDRHPVSRWRHGREKNSRLFKSSARGAAAAGEFCRGKAHRLLDVALAPLVCFDEGMRSSITPLALVLSLLYPACLLAASDQLEDALKAQSQARQEEKAREAQRQEQIENLKRDRDLDQPQRKIDQLERARPRSSRVEDNQRKLDQLKNDQQLQRLQDEQQINRIQRETDPLRQQQQIESLQRQQRIDSLQDQIRRNQVQQDLDRQLQRPDLHR